MQHADVKILIVDDNADICHALAVQLRASNHEATVAYDAVAGLVCGHNVKPDLILLDLG